MEWTHVAGIEPVVDEAAVEAELHAYLGYDDDTPAELAHREPWRITNTGQADWAMHRVAEAQTLIDDYDEQITRWKQARDRVEAGVEWFRARLEEWGVASRTKSVKTFPLAHGVVSTRESSPSVEVRDEEAAIAWAEVNCPDAVKTSKSFLVSRVGLAARIAPVVVAYQSVDKATGESERVEIEPVEFTDQRLWELQEKIGDGFALSAILENGVVDGQGNPVPGLGVRDAKVTANVKPARL